MASFCWVRLDNRLVHGQVCVAWIPQLAIERVVIVHDTLAKNAFMCKLNQSVVPKGVICDTITSDDAIAQWKENQFGDKRVLVLFPDTATANKMWHAGFEFSSMQVGTIPASKTRVQVSPQLNMDKDDAQNIVDLVNNGVEVFCQLVPEDNKTELKGLLEKANLI